MYTFATVTLDRVFLLTEAFRGFDIRTFGLEELHAALDLKHGALLIGAHLGSFDALRVLALQRPEQQVRPVIDLAQNPTVSKMFAALNPAIAASIINARQDGTTTALAIHEALNGYVVKAEYGLNKAADLAQMAIVWRIHGHLNRSIADLQNF